MADSKLRVNLIGDASSLNRSLQIASKRLETFGKRATQVGKDLSLRLSLPIGLAAGASIKMAASMEESLNKVRVSFGDSAKEVEGFAKTSLKSFGIAESSALDMTALFGDMATGMGVSQSEASKLSTRLVGLAGDLASFKDINIEEVTTALSGVFTGDTESLKRLGVVMTEVNLEQFRMQQGIQKSVKEMTQQEKIMLRLNYIFSVTKNAQGDFARTSDSAANQMRSFTEGLKELSAELGSILLPAFTDIITKVNELLDDFKNLDKGTQETIVQVGLLVAAVPPLIFIFGQLAESIASINTAILVLTGNKGLGGLASGLTKTTAIFAGAVLAYQQLVNTFTDLNVGFLESIDLFLTGLTNRTAYINKLFNKMPKKGSTPFAALDEDAEKASQSLDKLSNTSTPFANGGVSIVKPIGEEQALDNMVRAAENASAAIDNMLAADPSLTYTLATESAAVEYFGNVVKQTAENVRTPLDTINEGVQQMSELSRNLIMGIGQGLTSAFQQAMTSGENFVTSLANMLKDLIKRLIAAAAAAAILASLFPGLGTFSQLFGSFSGFGGGGGGSSSAGGFQFNPIDPNIGRGLNRFSSAGRNNINLTGQFRLDGQDLVVAVERANNQRSNFTG